MLLLLTVYKVPLFLFSPFNVVELNSDGPVVSILFSLLPLLFIFFVLGQLAIMVRFHTLAGALLSLSAFAYAAPQQSTPSVRTTPASATTTTTNAPVATAPCALAASAQAQYFSAIPNGKLKAGVREC
jgi:hypothetical protein